MTKGKVNFLTNFVKDNHPEFFSQYTDAVIQERDVFKELKNIEFQKEKFYDDLAEYLLSLVDDSNLQVKNFLLSFPVKEADDKSHEKLKLSKSKYLIDHLVREILTIAPSGIGINYSSNIYLDKVVFEKIEYYMEVSDFVKNVIKPINKKWKKFGTIKVEGPTKATRYAYQITFYSEPNIGRFLSF